MASIMKQKVKKNLRWAYVNDFFAFSNGAMNKILLTHLAFQRKQDDFLPLFRILTRQTSPIFIELPPTDPYNEVCRMISAVTVAGR